MKLLAFRAFMSAVLICMFVAASMSQRTADAFDDQPSRMRPVIERFEEDAGILGRTWRSQTSPDGRRKFAELYTRQIEVLGKINFDQLSEDERIDHILFANYIRHEQQEMRRQDAIAEKLLPMMPFRANIDALEGKRRQLEFADGKAAAIELENIRKIADDARASFEKGTAAKPTRVDANRLAKEIAATRETLKRWYAFYDKYDPNFTWWCESPYKLADEAIARYHKFIVEKLVGIATDDKTTIIGEPIGRDALVEELRYEMIPYSPEELLEIANKEFDWCIAEFKKASREMGYGDDYMRAIEAIKQKYVEPGKQPALIRDLAREAIDYVKKNDLVTVPKLAEESWRMEMMSPERQLVAPFFLGGETILVSYPTDGMTMEQKMMSMRGNNPYFARAVTHHELIPGHHLQGFMSRRYRPYRQLFYTPFSVEGWALYWEFLLWDQGFDRTPEEKIGALFWRSHRAARIIFSLNFHLGKWTPEQCVDLLVNKVGHERDNALGEVRRSFSGDYGPLYQVAYMMGGLQFYAMHHELVDS